MLPEILLIVIVFARAVLDPYRYQTNLNEFHSPTKDF